MAGLLKPRDGIVLLIADIDGTLITPEKTLTANAKAAVRRLSEAGIGFTVVSSRPPRGMEKLIEALNIKLPFVAFNGGALLRPDFSIIQSHHLSAQAADTMLELLTRRHVDAWVFAEGDWRLRDPNNRYVANHRRTVGFDPVIVRGFDDVIDRIDKIVGVSDNAARLAEVEVEARALLRGQATIDLSQARYLDVTHPEANKGRAAQALCVMLGVDQRQLAVIGDMMNDIAMFEVAGLAIAMGQAPDAVKARADAVARPNTEDGFADAIERFILPRAVKQLVS